MQFAIDQYALRGGHVAMFVDPLADADQSGPTRRIRWPPCRPTSLRIPALLAAWGVQFNPKQVVADRGHALQVSTPPEREPGAAPGVLGLNSSDFTPGDVITAACRVSTWPPPANLEPVKGAQTKFERVGLEPRCGTAPLERFQMLFDPNTLRDGSRRPAKSTHGCPRNGQRQDGIPRRAAGRGNAACGPERPQGVRQASQPVVYADTDMLTDYLWVHTQSVFGQRVEQCLPTTATSS